LNNRSRDIETLFQRMGAKPLTTRDPGVTEDAARAVQQWPLLAMLTEGLPAPRRPMGQPSQSFAEPARVPVNPPAIVPPAPVPPTAPAPSAPAQFAPAQFAPTQFAPAQAAPRSPLDALFQRAEQTGKPAAAPASVFGTAAPPPLKVPQRQSPLPPLPNLGNPSFSPPPAAPRNPAFSNFAPTNFVPGNPAPGNPAMGPVEPGLTIEPRPRQWQELDTVPAHLFERVGGR